jgi:hypothetical protein
VLAIEIVVSSLLFTLVVLAIVFSLVRRAIQTSTAKARAALEPEGIVMETPPVGGSVRYRNYRGLGRGGQKLAASRAIAALRVAVVLTKQQLALVGFRSVRIPRAELGRFSVRAAEGRLVLATDQPLDGTGHMEFRLRVPDPDVWVRALVEAGATAAAAA